MLKRFIVLSMILIVLAGVGVAFYYSASIDVNPQNLAPETTVPIAVCSPQGFAFQVPQTLDQGQIGKFQISVGDFKGDYEWNFGDNELTEVDAVGILVHHSYSKEGTYSGWVRVKDSCGKIKGYGFKVYAGSVQSCQYPDPDLDFTLENTLFKINQEITINVDEVDPSISDLSLNWQVVSAENNTIVFFEKEKKEIHFQIPKPGFYLVKLTAVEQNCSRSLESWHYIEIIDDCAPSVANIHFQVPMQVQTDQQICFEVLNPEKYTPEYGMIWSLSEKADLISNNVNFCYTFSETKPYAITVKAQDATCKHLLSETQIVIPTVANCHHQPLKPIEIKRNYDLIPNNVLTTFEVLDSEKYVAPFFWSFKPADSEVINITGAQVTVKFPVPGPVEVTVESRVNCDTNVVGSQVVIGKISFEVLPSMAAKDKDIRDVATENSVPIVKIDQPAVNTVQRAEVSIQGTCSEKSQPLILSGDVEPGIGDCNAEGKFDLKITLDGADGAGKKVQISQIKGTQRGNAAGFFTKDTQGPKLSALIKELEKNPMTPNKQNIKLQVACFDDFSQIKQCQIKIKDQFHALSCEDATDKSCSGIIMLQEELNAENLDFEIFGTDLVNNENHQLEKIKIK